MRALVTGGAGFIGSHVAEALLAEGHEVVVLDDLSTGNRANVPAGATFLEGSLLDAALVKKACEGVDVVVHHAAQTSVSVSVRKPILDAQVNVVGGVELLEAAAAAGAKRFVFASTGGAIYGDVPDGRSASLGDPARPESPYACSKLAFEGYLGMAQASGRMATVVLRYANVYGPRQDPHGEAGVVAIFLQRMLAGEPIQVNARKAAGDDGCVRDYVSVADVVRANLMAVAGEFDGETIHVCTGEGTTTRRLAEVLLALTESESEVRDGDPRAGDVERSVLSVDSRLAPEHSLEDGLRAAAEWFRGKAG
ncbi:MAG: NAD-dependent epimerase/dehydratase family protein [Myxococcota bacterium]